MKLEAKHWAVIAGLMTGFATQLLTAQHGWADIASPGFVAGMLIQLASAITAIFVGAPGATAALEQANRNTEMANASTRAALENPMDLGKVDPKRFIGPPALLLACALAAGVTTGCAMPASIGGRSTAQLSAPGVQAVHTVEAVKALDIIRDMAIDGEAAKITPTTTAIIVVTAHKSIIATIRAMPGGWKPSVLEALDQLKADIPKADAAHFGPYIDAAIRIIKAVIQ